MKRGPKGESEETKRRRATNRGSGRVTALYPDHASRPDPDEIPPPKGMSAPAKKLWHTKVDRYRQRGQRVSGFQDALRAFCELEAALHRDLKRGTATMAMINAHRLWCAEFFDTPAAQKIKASDPTRRNRFAGHGRRPETPDPDAT